MTLLPPQLPDVVLPRLTHLMLSPTPMLPVLLTLLPLLLTLPRLCVMMSRTAGL